MPVLSGFALATLGVVALLEAMRRGGLLSSPVLAVAVVALLLALGLLAARAARGDGGPRGPR